MAVCCLPEGGAGAAGTEEGPFKQAGRELERLHCSLTSRDDASRYRKCQQSFLFIRLQKDELRFDDGCH